MQNQHMNFKQNPTRMLIDSIKYGKNLSFIGNTLEVRVGFCLKLAFSASFVSISEHAKKKRRN